MMNILTKFKTPIIFILVVALCFFIYSNFFASSNTATPSGLIQTSAGGVSTSTQNDDFVQQLLTLQHITFKTDLLIDPAFVDLKDFSRPLVSQPIGRPNPFAPISGVSSAPAVAAPAASTTSSSKTPAKSS